MLDTIDLFVCDIDLHTVQLEQEQNNGKIHNKCGSDRDNRLYQTDLQSVERRKCLSLCFVKSRGIIVRPFLMLVVLF